MGFWRNEGLDGGLQGAAARRDSLHFRGGGGKRQLDPVDIDSDEALKPLGGLKVEDKNVLFGFCELKSKR